MAPLVPLLVQYRYRGLCSLPFSLHPALHRVKGVLEDWSTQPFIIDLY
jgi:hypothetical protein